MDAVCVCDDRAVARGDASGLALSTLTRGRCMRRRRAQTVPAAMDGVCQMFEKRLKELNPQMRSITYDINDLYHYIDVLPDLSALVFAPGARRAASQP